MDTMIVVWAVLIVVFFVVEGATAGLASIWFAAGALVALAAAFLDAPIWLQIAIFIEIITKWRTGVQIIKRFFTT